MAAVESQHRLGASVSGNKAASAPSMADTLPSIDFNFNELRERMAQFTVRFDEFIERGRKRVLEERNAFRMNLADLEDQQRQRTQAISELKSRSSNHQKTIAKEVQEKEEMQAEIEATTERKDENVAHCDQLKAEKASVEVAVRQRREAQAAHQRSLDVQARHNEPELRFWESCLNMRMESAGPESGDQIRFVFMKLDERDPDRECSFHLDFAGPEAQVASARPRLDRDAVETVLARFNDSRDENRRLSAFLKEMRMLFVDVIRG